MKIPLTTRLRTINNLKNKEMNRKIRIRFEDINLILIRNYYKATSAIEIFTTKRNKSYYFNFHGPFKDKNNLFKILDGIAF